MPSPPPIPPAERSPYGPDGVPKTVEDVSHRVRSQAHRLERDQAEPKTARRPDDILSLASLALVVLFGYALGAVIHRRSDQDHQDRSFRPRPGMMPEPVATYLNRAGFPGGRLA